MQLRPTNMFRKKILKKPCHVEDFLEIHKSYSRPQNNNRQTLSYTFIIFYHDTQLQFQLKYEAFSNIY